MNNGIILAGLLAIAGCATVPDELAEERHYRATDRNNRFLDVAQSCERQGGVLVVYATSGLSRARAARRPDSYRCTRPTRGITLR